MAKGQRLCAKPQKFNGPAAEKKTAVSQCKIPICTTEYRCVDLTMRMHTRIVVKTIFFILVQLILASALTFEFLLTVKRHHFVIGLSSRAVEFLKLPPSTNACVLLQMRPSSSSVQTVLGFKCIAPGCQKMFDSKRAYTVHRTTRHYAGTACADIQNGRQLISRGAASGDRPKLYSIPIAMQHGANHDGRFICVIEG